MVSLTTLAGLLSPLWTGEPDPSTRALVVLRGRTVGRGGMTMVSLRPEMKGWPVDEVYKTCVDVAEALYSVGVRGARAAVYLRMGRKGEKRAEGVVSFVLTMPLRDVTAGVERLLRAELPLVTPPTREWLKEKGIEIPGKEAVA